MEKTTCITKELDFRQLWDTFKELEKTEITKVSPSQTFCIRLDWIKFSSFTRWLNKPFDERLHKVFNKTVISVLEDFNYADFAYQQSDEISLLFLPKITDWAYQETAHWGRVIKILTRLSSLTTFFFNKYLKEEWIEREWIFWIFDARLFLLPDNLVEKYFIWRQEDASRNSVSWLAQNVIGKKKITWMGIKILQSEMLEKYDTNWSDLEVWKKRWVCFYKKNVEKTRVDNWIETKFFRTKWFVDEDMPILKKEWLEWNKEWVQNIIKK